MNNKQDAQVNPEPLARTSKLIDAVAESLKWDFPGGTEDRTELSAGFARPNMTVEIKDIAPDGSVRAVVLVTIAAILPVVE